jgi:hypothetical protein
MLRIDSDQAAQTFNLNPDEEALMDEISFEAPEKRTVKARPVRTLPKFSGRREPPPLPEDVGLDEFINPEKRFAPPAPQPEIWDGGEGDDGDDDGQGPGGPYQSATPQIPAEGYKTIEDEKADLLNKISRLIKKGIHGNGRLNSYSDIEEIRTEYKRMTYSIDVDRSIKFQRRMLIATVTGFEFLNKKFDPFDLQLDGWSENMMESVDDYDGVFEDLHNKYKNKIEVAPEVKLLMMVGGSAMMFHLTNSMFRSAVNVTQVMQQNPGLAQDMVAAVQRAQAESRPSPFQVPVAGGPPQQGLRGEMRGPGMDFGSLMGMMRPPAAAGAPPQVEEMSDIVSDAGGDQEVKEVSVSAGGKKGRRGTSNKKKEISI